MLPRNYNLSYTYSELGQGAAQAVEDVDALVYALGSAAVEDVPSRLLDVEAVRYERAHFVQQASRFLALTPRDSTGKQKATSTQQCSVV
jgi:2-polyprenyl-6-methoxyphenol hydroxylase-like FAD-dependent oxidoreductase